MKEEKKQSKKPIKHNVNWINKKELFRNWMIENCGMQDANNYEGTHPEEIAILFAEDYHKSETKALIEKHKLELKQAYSRGTQNVGRIL